jgi:AraC family transcriptional regulator
MRVFTWGASLSIVNSSESRLIEQELALLFDPPPAGSDSPRRKPPPRVLEDERVVQAVRLIESSPEQSLTLEQIAAHVRLSGPYFQLRFLEVMGESPSEYLRRTRLDLSAMLLIITSKSVLELALFVGYGSHEAFVRAFHRKFGQVPSQYRQFARRVSTPLHPEDEHLVKKVRIKTLPSQPALAMRFYGSYAQVEDNWRCFYSLLDQAGFALEDAQVMGIIHDNPEITPNHLVRYDCVIADTGTDLQHRALSRITLPASRFACLEHRGPYNQIFPAYRALGSTWLPRSGERLIENPCGTMERYQRLPWLSPGGEQWLELTMGLRG